ncbi:histone acetyltransferase KAT6B-like [Trachinotus anak]|uniref:histone acetyltransferase KAT6B-like n=1 Tax=Trachinotus anak TaxID=443729 RepID=UPI0039F1E77F
MGNCCCHTENPCGSVEERSGLLDDDSKTTAPTGVTVLEGTCGPDGDDSMRKTPDMDNITVEAKAEAVQVKQCPENGESEPSNTQENGPLKKENIQTAAAFHCKEFECKENSTGEQDEDMKDSPGNSGQDELLQSTLQPQQKACATADWEVFLEPNVAPKEEDRASVQEKIPVGTSRAAESICTEKPFLTETTTTTEPISVSTSHDDKEEAGSKVTFDNAVTEPSGEFTQNNEVLSVPNTQVDAAAFQAFPVSEVSQEINKDTSSCAETEDSDNGSSSVFKQAAPEDIKSHDVSESSPGSDPTEFNHSGEKRDSANSVREPETTPSADASEGSKSDQNAKPDSECSATSSKEVTSLDTIKQDIGEEMMLKEQEKDGDVPKAKEDDVMKEEAESAPSETETQAGNDPEIQEVTGKEEQPAGSSATDVKVEVAPVPEKEDSAEDDLGNSEEDLYRGAEELSVSQSNKPGPSVFETTFLKVEDRCSLAPAVDILSYSEREWKGNTAKSALIRKGYNEMSQRFGSLRRVRGDNYCALRATLFQVLSHSTQLPVWLREEEDITVLLKQLEAQEGLISQWTFPGDCLQGDGTGDVYQQLKGYMELLRNKWQAAVDCPSDVERQQLCEQVFQGGEEELGLLEALKLLMLGRAVELHGCMQGGGDVPLFCWLLFARDSSDCPRSFLSNHLSHVGLSAGLEQVEMFLLGYALQCTIEVYRLYKADTEEFVTYYPDDHKDDWPLVCLVTEDDRHYNVPVVEAAEQHKELNSS